MMNRIEISNNNTKVYDVWRLNTYEIEHIADKIIEMRKKKTLSVKRSRKSYINEMKAHKHLYLNNIERDRTRDADLEENIEWWREIGYKILAFLEDLRNEK